jgi:hypothetical protein
MEWYVFTTQEQAQDALDYVNSFPVFPIVGERAGAPDPSAQLTTCWCESLRQRVDGKWCFPRIPSERLDLMGVSMEQRLHFFQTFNPVVEEEQPYWWIE